MQPASFSSRLVALILDMIFFTVAGELLQGLAYQSAPELLTAPNIFLANLILSAVFFYIPTYKGGQTLGKKIMSIKVVSADNDEEPLTFGNMIMREVIGKTISTCALCIGFLWAFTNGERRTWHDRLGKTRVVSTVWQVPKSWWRRLRGLFFGSLVTQGILSLALFVLLYTSLPLDSIKSQVESRGLHVGTLSGSIAGGLHLSEFGRKEAGQNFVLKEVDIKFNLWELLNDRTFVIEKVTAQEGAFDVPAQFSWWSVLINVMAMNQPGTGGGGGKSMPLQNIKLGLFEVKNVSFRNQGQVVSYLEMLAIRNLDKQAKSFHIGEVVFNLRGLKSSFTDVGTNLGKISVGNAKGSVAPEMMPLLKVAMDFHFHGLVGKDLASSRIEGGMAQDKIKIQYDQKKMKTTIDRLAVKELFRTKLPFDNISASWIAEGASLMEFMMKQETNYSATLCGVAMKPSQIGVYADRPHGQYNFAMGPKPVADLVGALTRQDSSLDDIFEYHMGGRRLPAMTYASNVEMLSDFCFQKTVTELSPPQSETITNFSRVLVAMTANQRMPSAVPPTKALTAPVFPQKPDPKALAAATVKAAPKPEIPAGPPKTPSQVREAVNAARISLRTGKYAEGVLLLNAVEPLPSEILLPEIGAFYNLKGWLQFYASQPQVAAESFGKAFKARQDISDAEGMARATEALKKTADSAKWLVYIRNSVKNRPELRTRLSPNMQAKVSAK
jgi:uncharacterized RDD family membrane protein YckC